MTSVREQLFPMILPISLGLIIGGVASWFITRSPAPWLVFDSLVATYELGSQEILISGVYTVNRQCDHGSQPVIWRTEALATDGQIALYGPRPDIPAMTVGTHTYSAPLLLREPISPDGWRTTVIVTCTGAWPETVASPSTLVTVYTDPAPLR